MFKYYLRFIVAITSESYRIIQVSLDPTSPCALTARLNFSKQRRDAPARFTTHSKILVTLNALQTLITSRVCCIATFPFIRNRGSDLNALTEKHASAHVWTRALSALWIGRLLSISNSSPLSLFFAQYAIPSRS